MGVKFKVTDDGKTVDLSVRVSAIANGWVIKAGEKPYFCFTEDEVRTAMSDMLTEFLNTTKT
jgi:hypothetical protein